MVHDEEKLLKGHSLVLNDACYITRQTKVATGKITREYVTTIANIFLYTFAAIGLGWIVFLALQAIIQFEQRKNIIQIANCDCGESISTAISMGCKYDSLSVAWLPAHCRDDELSREFEQLGPGPNGTWLYWPGSDRQHKQVLNLSEVAALADDEQNNMVRTSADWHFHHCFFYWRKLHRAGLSGKIVEPDYNHEEHIRHCGIVFEERGTKNGDTRIWVRIGGSSLV